MESNGSPAMGLFVFWLMLQLVLMIALLVGGIYVLYCLGRAANGLDRLASAVEEWVRGQSGSHRNAETTPPTSALRTAINPAMPVTAPPAPHVSTPPISAAPISAAPSATEDNTSTIRPAL